MPMAAVDRQGPVLRLKQRLGGRCAAPAPSLASYLESSPGALDSGGRLHCAGQAISDIGSVPTQFLLGAKVGGDCRRRCSCATPGSVSLLTSTPSLRSRPPT